MKLSRTSLAGALLLLLLAGAVLYWAFAPRPVLVETADVVTATFRDTIEEDGRARVRDRYLVSAPISGQLLRTALKAGDAVKAGQTLALIAPPAAPLLDQRARLELEAQVGVSEAAVEEAAALHEQAKVLLQQAVSDFDRTKQLSERQVATAAQVERSESLVRSAQQQASAAERRWHAATHSLEQARAALESANGSAPGESFPVLSPIDGRILRVMQESEAVVGQAAALFEVGDPGDLEIAVDVLTADAARIRQGDKVAVTGWGGGTDLQGVVRRVEPSGFTKVSALGVEEQRVWVIIDITSPRETWSGLGDGFRVEASIEVDEIENATVVPVGALFRKGDAWNVFVVEAGRAHLREIDTARISARLAAVAKGLRPGETVVVYPTAALADGSKVRLDQ